MTGTSSELTEAIANRARLLGFEPHALEIRDVYTRESVRGDQLGKLLSQYQAGDRPAVELLARIGRPVKVTV